MDHSGSGGLFTIGAGYIVRRIRIKGFDFEIRAVLRGNSVGRAAALDNADVWISSFE
jgi:hypothetical protein